MNRHQLASRPRQTLHSMLVSRQHRQVGAQSDAMLGWTMHSEVWLTSTRQLERPQAYFEVETS